MHPSPFTNTNTINPASNYIYTIGTGTKMLAHGRKISTFSVWDKNFPLHVLLHESGLSDVKAGEMVDDIRDAIRDKQGDKERLLGDTEKQKFITEWCDNMRKKYFRTKQDSILSGDNREWVLPVI